MNEYEAESITRRVKDGWGGTMSDGQSSVWAEHLADLDYESVYAALRLLEREASRRPTIASLLETYRGMARARGIDRPSLRPGPITYKCLVCKDTGWEQVDPEGRGTVKACSRGCKPPRYDVTSALPTETELAVSYEGIRKLQAAFKEAEADRERRRRTLSVDQFIVSEGGDPSTHRVSRSGYVLRRQPDSPSEWPYDEARHARARARAREMVREWKGEDEKDEPPPKVVDVVDPEVF